MNIYKRRAQKLLSGELTLTDLKRFKEFKRLQNYTESYCQKDFRSAFSELAASGNTKPLIRA